MEKTERLGKIRQLIKSPETIWIPIKYTLE